MLAALMSPAHHCVSLLTQLAPPKGEKRGSREVVGGLRNGTAALGRVWHRNPKFMLFRAW